MPRIFVDDDSGALGYDPSTLHTSRVDGASDATTVKWESTAGPFALLFTEGSPFDGQGNAVHIQSVKVGNDWEAERTISSSAEFRSYKYRVAVVPDPPNDIAPFIDNCPEVIVEC